MHSYFIWKHTLTLPNVHNCTCQRQNSYPGLTPNPDLQIAIPSVLFSWCFKMMGNMIRPVTSMSASPLMHFISCEMSSLVRSNAVWNTMTVNKIFCKSVDGDVGREDKLICRIPTYSSGKKNVLPKWKWSNVIDLQPGAWLVSSKSGIILGALCW